MRSRHTHARIIAASRGIISACAEQTLPLDLPSMNVRDHLRVCGADTSGISETYASLGSSPRVRSRRNVEQRLEAFDGIISACAEQTNTIAARAIGRRDHLRVCGADARESRRLMCWAGSSPRVRSRRLAYHGAKIRIGIISACAEQTFQTAAVRRDRRDHLRVCGADQQLSTVKWRITGSSPRVRSRRSYESSSRPFQRIISACAEQTGVFSSLSASDWDHLRVCGADESLTQEQKSWLGSSPRVRSRRSTACARSYRTGIISACAEQTYRPLCVTS